MGGGSLDDAGMYDCVCAFRVCVCLCVVPVDTLSVLVCHVAERRYGVCFYIYSIMLAGEQGVQDSRLVSEFSSTCVCGGCGVRGVCCVCGMCCVRVLCVTCASCERGGMLCVNCVCGVCQLCVYCVVCSSCVCIVCMCGRSANTAFSTRTGCRKQHKLKTKKFRHSVWQHVLLLQERFACANHKSSLPNSDSSIGQKKYHINEHSLYWKSCN